MVIDQPFEVLHLNFFIAETRILIECINSPLIFKFSGDTAVKTTVNAIRFLPFPVLTYNGLRAHTCSILLRELNFSGRLEDQSRFKPLVTYKLTQIHLPYAYDHTTMNTPVLV